MPNKPTAEFTPRQRTIIIQQARIRFEAANVICEKARKVYEDAREVERSAWLVYQAEHDRLPTPGSAEGVANG
jgi:hypothetical protein